MTFGILLEVTIGLVLVYALFSLMTTVVLEIVNAGLNRRGRMLEFAIYFALDGERPYRGWWWRLLGRRAAASLNRHPRHCHSLADRFFSLQSIRTLMDKDRLPSYVSADAFADGVVVLLNKELGLAKAPDDYAAHTRARPSRLATLVNEFFPSGEVSEAALKLRLARYYEDMIERVKGWFKRENTRWLFIIGLLIAALFNVNSIDLARSIASDSELRERLVVAAEAEAEAQRLTLESRRLAATIDDPDLSPLLLDDAAAAERFAKQRTEDLEALNAEVGRLGLPIGKCRDGWFKPRTDTDNTAAAHGELTFADQDAVAAAKTQGSPCSQSDFLYVVGEFVGWSITALALSLGAPFWFDLLIKLVALRKAGGFRTGEESALAKSAGVVSPENNPAKPPTIEDIPVGPPLDNSRSTPAAAPAVAPAASAPPNAWELEYLSKDDILDIQRLLGLPSIYRTGRLDEETRKSIREFRQAQMNEVNPSEFIDRRMVLQLYEKN